VDVGNGVTVASRLVDVAVGDKSRAIVVGTAVKFGDKVGSGNGLISTTTGTRVDVTV